MFKPFTGLSIEKAVSVQTSLPFGNFLLITATKHYFLQVRKKQSTTFYRSGKLDRKILSENYKIQTNVYSVIFIKGENQKACMPGGGVARRIYSWLRKDEDFSLSPSVLLNFIFWTLLPNRQILFPNRFRENLISTWQRTLPQTS